MSFSKNLPYQFENFQSPAKSRFIIMSTKLENQNIGYMQVVLNDN